jgi:drug/metabolite transporter (DMT)-like permease
VVCVAQLLVILFSLIGACMQALSSTLQWDAEATLPLQRTGDVRLEFELLRRPEYLAGIGCLIGGFLAQAAALSRGELAVVQPLLMCELPFTLLLSAAWLKLGIDRREIAGAVTLIAGLAVLLAVGHPTGNRTGIPGWTWLAALGGVVLVVAALELAARGRGRSGRAALFGTEAGLGFAFTAALMKAATARLDAGFAALFTSWQVYAMAVAGICSVLFVQRAFKAGPLAAAQPALTATNPLGSILLGVGLFGERLRGGTFILPELIGAAIICYGIWELTRSPLVSGHCEGCDSAQLQSRRRDGTEQDRVLDSQPRPSAPGGQPGTPGCQARAVRRGARRL